jgi:hypothetical protein
MSHAASAAVAAHATAAAHDTAELRSGSLHATSAQRREVTARTDTVRPPHHPGQPHPHPFYLRAFNATGDTHEVPGAGWSRCIDSFRGMSDWSGCEHSTKAPIDPKTGLPIG